MDELDKIIDEQIYSMCDSFNIYMPESGKAKARKLVKVKLVSLIMSQVSKSELSEIADIVFEEEIRK